MKTFKKLLLSAGILFNSCAIIAMDSEAESLVSTVSAKVKEKMNLLKTRDLKINQQNDIRALLLKALDTNGKLKSESLSRDEQDAVDLIKSIEASMEANKEPRGSFFYQNIKKISEINSATSSAQNASSLESQNTLKDFLSNLCTTTDTITSQPPETESNRKKAYYSQFYRGNKASGTRRKNFSKKNSTNESSPLSETNGSSASEIIIDDKNPLEYYHRLYEVIAMDNPMKPRTITAPSQLSTPRENSSAKIISPNRDNEENMQSNTTTPPLDEAISEPSPVDISQLMASLTSARLDNDKLNEIKILLLEAFDKKGVLKPGALSANEQASADLLNAIQANSETPKSTFYENINEIATTCSPFKQSEKAVKSIFEKLYQDANTSKPKKIKTEQRKLSPEEIKESQQTHEKQGKENEIRRKTELKKRIKTGADKLRPEQIKALKDALGGKNKTTEEELEKPAENTDQTAGYGDETSEAPPKEDSISTHVVQSRPTIQTGRRRSSTSKRTAVMPKEELITKLSEDNNDEMESAVMPFDPNGDDKGDTACVIQ